MKKIIVLLTVVISLSLANKASAQVYGSVNFNTFYTELSPYGRWVNDMDYGQVWIANEQGFEPYYNNGHWVYTSYGWTWVSDYSWGWAPFHYGRWTYLPAWGWAWVPGYEWGPAWVSWCQNDGYYGWAPMGPGYGFNTSFNSIPRNYWRFVQQQYITGPSIRNHIIRPERNPDVFRNASIINNTQVNNNVRYEAGPRREAVERITRQKIETRPVAFNATDERTRVDNREVRIYRPEMKPKQSVNNAAAVEQNKGAAVQNNRLPKNTPATVTNGKPQTTVTNPALPANSNLQPPVTAPQEKQVTGADDRRVKPLPSTMVNTNKELTDNAAAERKMQLLKDRQQAQRRDDLKPVTAPQTANQPDAAAQQRLQQEQERRQAQAAQQQEQRRQLQLQKDQQQNELRQQQAQQLRQQQLDQQKQQELQNRQRENEQRQEQLKAQREQQQQQNMQGQQELRQQREQQQLEQRQQRLQQQQQQNIQRQHELHQQRSLPDRPQPVKKFS